MHASIRIEAGDKQIYVDPVAHSMLVCTRDGYTKPAIDPIDKQRLQKGRKLTT